MNSSLEIDENTVNIYIRNYKKHAAILAVKRSLSGRQLREVVRSKYLSKINDFILFFKGKRIEQNQTLITLEAKSIVHIVDLQRTNFPSLNLTFKVHKSPNEFVNVKVTPQTVIRDILRENIHPVIGKGEKDVFLVYLGKPLNIFKKFEEEFIEEDTQILIVEFKGKSNQNLAKTQVETSLIHQKQSPNAESLKETVKVGTPAMGGRPHEVFEEKKMKMTTSIAQKSNFEGFNPHPDPAAPGSAAPPSSQDKHYEGNLVQIPTAPPQNPEQGGPNTQIGDTIFSAEDDLPETINITSQTAKELKESMKKK